MWFGERLRLDDEKHDSPSSTESVIDDTALFKGLDEITGEPLTLDQFDKIESYKKRINEEAEAYSSTNIASISSMKRFTFFHAATLDCLMDRLTKHYERGEMDQVDGILTFRPDMQIFLRVPLLTQILHGNIDVAEKIIKICPTLLLEKGDAVSPSGHKAHGTAYQLALAVEDTHMAEMIKAQLIKIADENEANAQFHEQFPEGWEESEKEKWAPIFAQLEVLTQAIRHAQPGDIISSGYPDYKLTVREGSAVAAAHTQFRSLLVATLDEVITTGHHFNDHLLLKAFQIYDAHFHDYFGNDWSNRKAMMFWQRVIGYIQRFMPVNYVQAFCDGLYNTHENLQKGKVQGRLLKFGTYHANRWVPTEFYPLSSSHLGFHFAIYGCGGTPGRPGGVAGAGWHTAREGGWWHCPLAHGFRMLMSIKNSSLTESLLSTKTPDVRRQNRFV